MAVYTKISAKNIKNFFLKYDLGEVINHKGIQEGIENTNYSIQTNKGKFILTIYEKRVQENDLPFFMGLMKNLYDSNFKCPKPIINRNGSYISEIESKKAAVVSFLPGNSKKNLSPDNCLTIGTEVAKMHMITKKLNLKRENKLSVSSWRKIYENIKNDCSKIHPDLIKIIEKI